VPAGVNLPQCMEMTPTQWGAVGSLYTLGGLIGALSAGPLAGRVGRRRTMLYTTIFFAVGPVFEALSPNMGVMAFGRFISGLGAGASVVVVPIFISEIAPPAERGFFGAFTQVMCNVGILIAQLLGYFLSHGQYWRIILAAGGIIGMCQSLGLLVSVESPKYLAEQGHIVQAKRILRKMRGEKFDIDEEVSSWGIDGSTEVTGMRPKSYICSSLTKYVDEEPLLQNEDGANDSETTVPKRQLKEDALSIIQVLRHPEHNKAALAVIMVMIAQQFSGKFQRLNHI
jgi:MFS family permease